jgi:hypothetical protein
MFMMDSFTRLIVLDNPSLAFFAPVDPVNSRRIVLATPSVSGIQQLGSWSKVAPSVISSIPVYMINILRYSSGNIQE